MSRTFTNTDQYTYMKQAWDTWQESLSELDAEYAARRREVDEFHKTEFVHSIQQVRLSGGAKNWIRRATGITPWPEIQKWWELAGGDPIVRHDVNVPFPDMVSRLVVDGHLLLWDDMNVRVIMDDKFYAFQKADGEMVWTTVDGIELSWEDRLEMVSDNVETAVRDTRWGVS